MINEELKLNPDLFKDDVEKAPTRNGFGEGLVLAGKANKDVVALTADLSESTRAEAFAKEFPERFFEVGIAEQNLVSVASGMAHLGKIPFATSYAAFSPGRNWEQIRTTICYNNQNVKIIGSHAGLMTGPDGGTHQALEDLALTRVLPNMVVISPCDAIEAKKATLVMSKTKNPTYLRLSREKVPVITTEETPFEIGKALTFFDHKDDKIDVGIVVTGVLVHSAIMVAKKMSESGKKISVMNLSTIKPIDREAIVKLAKRSGAIVTVEEHQVAGGMGSVVAEVLAESHPVPIEFVGVKDRFGQSGDPKDLISEYGIDSKSIEKAIKKILSVK